MQDAFQSPRERVIARAKKFREAEAAVNARANELHQEIAQLRSNKAPAEDVALLEELRRIERVASVQFAHNARALEEAAAAGGGVA
jgi:transcriptional regulator NrdR family protein